MKNKEVKIFFTKKLLQWNKKNERSFPWKETNDPYKIWLSEIILQQTRVEQGLPYYLKMIKLFPTVKQLSSAKEDSVLKAWQGLGYYSRARNLHTAAKYVVHELKGFFPEDYNGWLKLKGVGPYAAAAIVSFAYNLPHAVVDGNVYRVLSRYFGIDTPIDSTNGKKIFSILANELIAKKEPGRFNQAIMDFGATACKPTSPLCISCIMARNCLGLKNNLIATLPVKEKNIFIKNRFFHFVVAENEKGFLMEKRKGKDIWQGLYQFPLIETKKFLSIAKLQSHPTIKSIFKGDKSILKASETVTYMLSHQKIQARFFTFSKVKITPKNYIIKSKTNLQKMAVPKIIEDYIKKIIL